MIETATSQPLETSVGGHPVLLGGGQVLELNQRDPKVRDRHPRTLGAWTAGGDLLLLTVNGRQPGYSQGITLVEAQHLLLSLGAVDGINLDAGGSSTFVAASDSGRCVRNRPSDGTERRVTGALAVVAAPPTSVSVTPDRPAPTVAAEPATTSGLRPSPHRHLDQNTGRSLVSFRRAWSHFGLLARRRDLGRRHIASVAQRAIDEEVVAG